MLLLLLAITITHAAFTREDLIDKTNAIYAAFGARDFQKIQSLNSANCTWISYGLPYSGTSTKAFHGREGILEYMKAGFGLYNLTSFNPHLPGRPWAVDTASNIVVVPGLAKGTLVATGRAFVSHNVHYWLYDAAGLAEQWIQHKVTYIEEPLDVE
jgi:hypothetical protein